MSRVWSTDGTKDNMSCAKVDISLYVKQPKRSTEDILNADHIGVEFYVHVPHSTAPMHEYLYEYREEADTIAEGLGGEVFVREVGEWKKAP